MFEGSRFVRGGRHGISRLFFMFNLEVVARCDELWQNATPCGWRAHKKATLPF
jgi:hypothetical protein